jgi:UDP-N-acetylmuramoyl-L-alanyl-D-glutamate--2,6-diaminopimelate ligase
MSLSDLFRGLLDDHGRQLPDTVVTDISTDSRRVQRGGLFLACKGLSSHGLDYLDAALEAGCAAVVWDPAADRASPELPPEVTGLAIPGLGRLLGELSDRFFAAPSAELAVTAITGTNGKTSVASILAQALQRLGERPAYIGTVGSGLVGAALKPASLTTPAVIDLHRELRALRNAGATQAVIEASSHGLDQRRLDGLRLAVGAITNISRDHLDYHGDYAAYRLAKSRLFTDCRPATAVINLGDDGVQELAAGLPDALPQLTVALVRSERSSPAARLLGHLHAVRRSGIGLRFNGDFGDATLNSRLWGEFNAENLLVAAGCLLALGFGLRDAAAALAECEAPAGRLQRVRGAQSQPEAVVDFAHTPAALRAALLAIRQHSDGRLWLVFGCGGDRDTGKRAEMGAVASALADEVVLTDDNPRSEDPEAIASEVMSGIEGPGAVRRIADRAGAIRFALESAAADDVVLIAGKGHETQQWYADGPVPFSDAATARDVLSGAA